MNPDRDLERLTDRFEELAHVVGWPDERLYLKIETVSAWSPAQHVDHALRALHLVFDAVATLQRGEAPASQAHGAPNLAGFTVLTTGWIPRGRGRAPEPALPEPRPVRHRLREAVHATAARARALRADAEALATLAGTLEHPVLGAFRAAHWIRFGDVHTRHHLAIVADIDRRRAVGALAPLLGEEGEWSAHPEAP